MKEFVITPKTEGFVGTVKMKVPSYKERMDELKKLGIKIGKDGADMSALNMEDMLTKAQEKLEESVLEIDLKFGDVEFKSLEDLGHYAEGTNVISELGQILMTGISLGKS